MTVPAGEQHAREIAKAAARLDGLIQTGEYDTARADLLVLASDGFAPLARSYLALSSRVEQLETALNIMADVLDVTGSYLIDIAPEVTTPRPDVIAALQDAAERCAALAAVSAGKPA